VRGVVVKFARSLTLLLVVFSIVALYRLVVHVNPTTVAVTYLLAVLVVSATWGLWYAIAFAIAATLAFNYFFLPPVGTFTIADTQNWIALVAFLATAIIASELSERARREARDATQRRREVERLYNFTQQLLTSESVVGLLNALPRYIVEAFGARSAALLVTSHPNVYRSGPDTAGLDADTLRLVAARGEPVIDPAGGTSVVPIRLGVKSVGALGVAGHSISRTTLEAIGSLIAIALERAGAVESLARAEASREGEKLRSAILDSVTHEFRTPLTAIKASATTILDGPAVPADQLHDLIVVINEEADRLDRLVSEATQMAQLDANQVELQLQSQAVRPIIERAVHEAGACLEGHPVEVNAPAGLPNVRVDADRIRDVLLHLLENAAKYSPPGAPIRITAEAEGSKAVRMSVADAGAGIDDFEQTLIFDKFYRGRDQRYRIQGTGMGLAIAKAIVEAHGGQIGVVSQREHGSVFWFTVPTDLRS
jgi:two-component system, OmpR family, sensor histidine kinase KdpD